MPCHGFRRKYLDTFTSRDSPLVYELILLHYIVFICFLFFFFFCLNRHRSIKSSGIGKCVLFQVCPYKGNISTPKLSVDLRILSAMCGN